MREQAEQERTRNAAKTVVQSLAAHVRACWQAAHQARQPVEARMMTARRQRRGEYEPAKLAEIRKTGGSEIFMMLTAVKCRAAEAWLSDTLMPAGDRPWTVEPTPVPELRPDEEQQITDTVRQAVWNEGVQRAMQAGLSPDLAAQEVQAMLPEMERRMRDLIDRDRLDRSKVLADKMADRIEDLLVQGGWSAAFGGVLSDLTTYPAAFLAGPILRRRKAASWGQDPDTGKWTQTLTDQIVVDVERVSPFDIYPSPWSTSVDDGYLIRRHRLNRADLTALKGVPGYDDSAINAVLDSYGRGGLREWLTQGVDAEIRRETGTEIGPDRPIDALEFWGSVPGSMLVEWGVPAEQVPDRTVEVDACIWLVGNWVIKAMLNPDSQGRKPFYKASYELVPGEFWGRAVPELIEDSQAMCNAAARALANNMGISSGPQVEINVDRIPDGENITTMYPWKIWQTTSDQTGNGHPAIRFFQPQGMVGELIAIFDRFSRIADDESGVPSYSYGDARQGGAASTASGLSMLFNASGKGIKSVIANLDGGIIAPVIERIYDYLMRYDADDSIKGDLRIVARGASALVVREQVTARRQELLAQTANPLDSQIMGMEGRAELLREVVKSADIPVDRIVPNRNELAQKVREIQVQAQPPVAPGQAGGAGG